jgi:hypothetical protein
MTWDRRLYFPSEESFIILKSPPTLAGFEPVNPGSSGENANHKSTEGNLKVQ